MKDCIILHGYINSVVILYADINSEVILYANKTENPTEQGERS